MNVSKINVLNVNKSGVSLFRGDTPVHSDTKNKKAEMPASTKFLYGAGIVSAGILALALAGRAGLFTKKIKNAGTELSEEASNLMIDVLKEREIVKQIPSKFTTAEVSIRPSRAERLKANAVDTEALKSNFNYAKYKKAETPDKKNKFFEQMGDSFHNMSYEEQFEELSHFLKFVETLKPEDVKVPFDIKNLKRNNNYRFTIDIMSFTEKNPQYEDVFKPITKNYQIVMSKQIENLPYEEQYKEFCKFLKKIKTLKLVNSTININFKRLKQDNLEKFMQTTVKFMDKNPKYKNCFNSMLANYAESVGNTIKELPYEEQYKKFGNYLEFIKSVESSQTKIGINFLDLHKDNNERFINKAFKFIKENPKYRPAFKEFFSNYSSSIEKQIYVLPYEEQNNKFTSFLEFVKKLEPSEVVFHFNHKKLNEDTSLSFARLAKKFVNDNPQYKNCFQNFFESMANDFIEFSKYEAEFGIQIKDALFNRRTGMRAAFFTNSEHKIQAMPYEKQVEGFKQYLDFIKTLNHKDIEKNILFIPGKFDWDKNVEIAKEAIAFAKINSQFKDTIINNLLAYETDMKFGKELAYANFGRTDNLAVRYDQHVDNFINIRKLLTESGLKCDENARMKNRQDWIDIGLHTSNQFRLGFQYAERLPEARRAAFAYDLMNGITRKDADEIIKKLSSDTSVVKKELNVIVEELEKDGIPKDKTENTLKNILENNELIRKTGCSGFDEIAKLQQIADETERKDAMQLIEKQTSDNINEIQNKINNLYKELEKLGIGQEKTDYILKQLTSQLTVTETEKLYGMKLNEMIEKINQAVI